jgi:hypothetical protein
LDGDRLEICKRGCFDPDRKKKQKEISGNKCNPFSGSDTPLVI